MPPLPINSLYLFLSFCVTVSISVSLSAISITLSMLTLKSFFLDLPESGTVALKRCYINPKKWTNNRSMELSKCKPRTSLIPLCNTLLLISLEIRSGTLHITSMTNALTNRLPWGCVLASYRPLIKAVVLLICYSRVIFEHASISVLDRSLWYIDFWCCSDFLLCKLKTFLRGLFLW